MERQTVVEVMVTGFFLNSKKSPVPHQGSLRGLGFPGVPIAYAFRSGKRIRCHKIVQVPDLILQAGVDNLRTPCTPANFVQILLKSLSKVGNN